MSIRVGDKIRLLSRYGLPDACAGLIGTVKKVISHDDGKVLAEFILTPSQNHNNPWANVLSQTRTYNWMIISNWYEVIQKKKLTSDEVHEYKKLLKIKNPSVIDQFLISDYE